MGPIARVKGLPSPRKDHWTYAIPCQRHLEASTNHRIKIEKTRIELNWTEGPRGNHNRLESFKNGLYGKRGIMTSKLACQNISEVRKLSTNGKTTEKNITDNLDIFPVKCISKEYSNIFRDSFHHRTHGLRLD